MPLRALLDQLAPDFPGFCKVGTGHNKKISFDAQGFIAVTDSVHLLQNLHFDSIFVDEAHHPQPSGMPKGNQTYQFSATHKNAPDFHYSMGQAIEDGVLSDYDITVPAISQCHAYVCLANLLLKQAGRFRRVLAYCNTVSEARRFRMVLEGLGLAAWHMNARTPLKRRQDTMEEFAGDLKKPVHVLVTVEVLGEGINIPNADTCMFVEPRRSYRSIVQAIGRVLRDHPSKLIAHIVLPAVTLPKRKPYSSVARQVDSDEEYPSSVFSALRADLKEAGDQVFHKKDVQTARGVDKVHSEADKSYSDVQDFAHGNSDLSKHEVEEAAKSSHSSRHQHFTVPNREPSVRAVPSPHEEPHLERWNSNRSGHNEKEDGGERVWETKKGFRATTRRAAASHAKLQEALSNPSSDRHLKGASTTWNGRGLKQTNGKSGCVQTEPLDSFHAPGSSESTRPGPTGHHARSLHRASGAPGGDAYCNETVSAATFDGSMWHDEPGEEIQRVADLAVGMRQHEVAQGEFGGQRSFVTFKGHTRDAAFSAEYGSQLERFLELLMRADSRLVGAAPGRIHIVDCSLGLERELGLDCVMEEVQSRLMDVLCQADPWETRLKHVETFAAEHGRLPRQGVDGIDFAEAVLGNWLHNQGRNLQLQVLPPHRLHRLLNARSPLIRHRAQRWAAGGQAGNFWQQCEKLKQYIEVFGCLPTKTIQDIEGPHYKLAAWLYSFRSTGAYALPQRRKMLVDIHPLVKALVQKWEEAPIEVDAATWQGKLEQVERFVQVHGRLPKYSDRSTGVQFQWLGKQFLLHRRGVLPSELSEQLRRSHRLIAAACKRRRKVGRKDQKGNKFQRSSSQA